MSRHEKVFHEFRRRLEEELGDDLDRVILFGSVAREEAREESDVDVIVVLSRKDCKEKVFDISYDLMLENDVYVSPKVLDEEEFQEMQGTSFMKELQEEMQEYAEA